MKLQCALAAIVLTGGCAYRTAEYTTGDGSELCLTTEPMNPDVEVGDQSFDADGRAWVNVVFHEGIGEECDQIESVQCTLAYDGSTVFVDAHATWRYRKKREACNGPSTSLIASCQTVGLEPDAWSFSYGDNELRLEVPSDGQTPCMSL